MLFSLVRYLSLIRLFTAEPTQSQRRKACETLESHLYESQLDAPFNDDTMAEWLRRLITIQIPLGAQVRFFDLPFCFSLLFAS